MELPRRVQHFLIDAKTAEDSFRVLKDAHKDIMLNYDKFVLNCDVDSKGGRTIDNESVRTDADPQEKDDM